jgi:quinol-cytochrome oxidoreductase complex cytochrome b subunit
MNNRRTNWLPGVFVGVLTNVTFWVLYSFTENLVGSIGITAGVGISASGILYMLGRIKRP